MHLTRTGRILTAATIAVPEECADPTVLIQPSANRTVYIASGASSRHDDHSDDWHAERHRDGAPLRRVIAARRARRPARPVSPRSGSGT